MPEQRESLSSERTSCRWTLYRYGDFDWHLGIAPGALVVEVMPVSEHDRLREAAQAFVEADSVLHASAPSEMWERYTEAIVRLRAALGEKP